MFPAEQMEFKLNKLILWVYLDWLGKYQTKIIEKTLKSRDADTFYFGTEVKLNKY